jgi:AraC-like DNA-binding protein
MRLNAQRPTMAQSTYKPAFPLSQYVEFIWRTTNSRVAPSRQRVYPNGAMALVIHLNKPTASYYFEDRVMTVGVPLLAGPYSMSFHMDPSESSDVISVLFRPGAGRVFFPVPAQELHNNDVGLNELYPGEGSRLLDQLCSASSVHLQYRILERYLCRKLKYGAPVHPAVSYAIRELASEGGLRRVRQIQLDTGFSHTRFNQLFREQVGLTPKLFGRVRRFHALLGRIEKGLPLNWADLAADCGYFDQAHLIHDFRAFAGVTPLEYSRAIPCPPVAVAENAAD